MGGWGLAFLSPRLRGVRVFAICVLGQSVGLGVRLRRRNLCSHSRVFLLTCALSPSPCVGRRWPLLSCSPAGGA